MRQIKTDFMNFIKFYGAWRHDYICSPDVEESDEFQTFFNSLNAEKFLEYRTTYEDYLVNKHSTNVFYAIWGNEDFIPETKISAEELYNEILLIDPGLCHLIDYARKIPIKMNDMSRIIFDIAHGYSNDINAAYDACMLKVFRIALAHHKMLNINLADAIQSGFLGIESAIREVKFNIHHFYTLERQRILLALNRCIEREICLNNQYSDSGIFLHNYDDLIKIIKYVSHHPEFYHFCKDADYLRSIAKKIPIPYERLNILCKSNLFESVDINELEDEEATLILENTLEKYDNELLREREEFVLRTLTPREEQIIRMRFGLDGERPKLIEEVCKKFDITRERVRQIEAKALRKLRHPSRCSVLLSGFGISSMPNYEQSFEESENKSIFYNTGEAKMRSHANESLIKIIQQHGSPLCKDPEELSLFSVNAGDDISLGLFARKGKILLQLTQKQNDVELSITFNDFDAEQGVDSILFSYNSFNMCACIDKKKATPKGEMVFDIMMVEDGNLSKEIFEKVKTSMEHLCNLFAGMTLSIVKEILIKEDAGISLADFGYINF